MMHRIIIFLFFSFSLLQISGQNMDDWIYNNEKVPSEKIYIHTDCENYFLNDTIWLKVYLTDSRSGKLIPSAENVYINILDNNGSPVLQTILLAVNGEASGQISVPDTLKPGKYMMQAFTNYLLNFSNHAHFYKPVSIFRISGYSRSSTIRSRTENMVADVSFLPEGGILLENVTNIVAFKAISREGYGVNASGTIKDERGNTVTTFTTDYKGMGLLFLTPEPGKSYTAQVTGFPSFRYQFEPVQEGLKIQLVNHTSKEVILNIAGNSEKLADKTFYLANMHRGEVLFYQEFKLDGMNKVLKFDNNSLKDGINRLVLLDEDFKPLSERLIFERPKHVNNMLVQLEEQNVNTREEIIIQIADEKYISQDDFSSLSVSVVHKAAIPVSGWYKNILSQLLIDSELNGFVESSADLFTDNELSSDAKLRLVMLTNGWSGYFWNEAPNSTDSLQYMQKGGLNLNGVAKNPLTGNPVQDGEITVVIQKDTEIGFITNMTDQGGNFSIPGLLFSDTALIYVQAKTETGKMNTDVVLEPVFKISPANELQLSSMTDNSNVSEELSKMKYNHSSEIRRYMRTQNGNQRRKQVQNASSDDGHFRLYKSADFVLEMDESEESFENIIDYMVGKVPGLDINGNEVRIRGASSFAASSTPLFLVDGIPVAASQTMNLPEEVSASSEKTDQIRSDDLIIQSIKMIPINDVDKIEILKSPTNLASYGVKGANGVIAIYTRHGKQAPGDANARGIIEKKIVGYSEYRDFYAPIYSPENKDNERPDWRTTLYWNPEVKTSKGLAEIRFFSSDEVGSYQVFVEGISNDGKICAGTAEFEVERFRQE